MENYYEQTFVKWFQRANIPSKELLQGVTVVSSRSSCGLHPAGNSSKELQNSKGPSSKVPCHGLSEVSKRNIIMLLGRYFMIKNFDPQGRSALNSASMTKSSWYFPRSYTSKEPRLNAGVDCRNSQHRPQ